ncbi:hypothetical protein [Streptomyces ehimensis]|uniref:Uncharacterized protein n=1 Tax=Streptomyces ehimensis TaxID=68195 RepID=A0ABV9BVB4_9ACTN
MTQPLAPLHGSQYQPTWTPLDEYLWHSCDIIADVLEGHLNRRPLIATTARLDPGEQVLAVGPGQRQTWRALGDGNYSHNSVVAFGNPAFVIGSMVGAALGNSARRRQAALDAQPRWVLDGPGEATITPRRVHFRHPTAGLDLDWAALSEADLAAPDVFQASFVNTHGQYWTVRIHTPWASLMFVLAAINAFPAHPRLLARSWLPPDFENRCAAMGRPCRPATDLALQRHAT